MKSPLTLLYGLMATAMLSCSQDEPYYQLYKDPKTGETIAQHGLTDPNSKDPHIAIIKERGNPVHLPFRSEREVKDVFAYELTEDERIRRAYAAHAIFLDTTHCSKGFGQVYIEMMSIGAKPSAHLLGIQSYDTVIRSLPSKPAATQPPQP